MESLGNTLDSGYLGEDKLKENSSRSRTIIYVFYAICFVNLIAVISGYFEVELLERIGVGADYTDEEVTQNDLRQGVIGLLQTVLSILSIVFFLNWFRRAYGNLHRLNVPGLEFPETMAVWTFFIPIVNLYRPYKIAKEIYKETFYNVYSSDSPEAKATYNTFLIGLWWTVYIITSIIGNITFRIFMRGGDTIDSYITTSKAYLISDGVDIFSAVFTILMIRHISNVENELFRKHTGLTAY